MGLKKEVKLIKNFPELDKLQGTFLFCYFVTPSVRYEHPLFRETLFFTCFRYLISLVYSVMNVFHRKFFFITGLEKDKVLSGVI